MEIQNEWRRRFRIKLETPRLLLRPLIPGDEEWLAPIWGDHEVNRYTWDPNLTPEQARRAAEVMVELDSYHYHFGQWAIQEKETGIFRGWAELSKLRPWWGPGDEIGLSYVLTRESWGRGLATEAAGRLLQHAFDSHGLECVMAVVVAGNAASKRVLEKLGMRLVKSETSDDGKPLEFYRVDNPSEILHGVR